MVGCPAREAQALVLWLPCLAAATGLGTGGSGALAPTALLRTAAWEHADSRAAAAVSPRGAVLQQRQQRSQPQKEWFEYVLMPDDDLVAVRKGPLTESHMTEVAITTAGSDYKYLGPRNPTGLANTDGRWCFLPTPGGDIAAVVTGPFTASGKTELYWLSQDSHYTAITGSVATGLAVTTMQESSFVMDPFGDLWRLQKADCNGNLVAEVHVLTALSNYQNFTLHMHTGMSLPASGGEPFFFATPDRDLLVVQTTDITRAELWTRQSGYKSRLFRADLPINGVQAGDQFAMRKNGDLVFIDRPLQQGKPSAVFLTVLDWKTNFTKIAAEHTTAFLE